ncbi:hypothetical protein KIPB_010629, partial [Kipferlia bialata]
RTVFTAKDLGIESDGKKPDFGIDGMWLYYSLGSIAVFCYLVCVVLFFMKGMFYRDDLDSLLSNYFTTGFCLTVVCALRYLNTRQLKFISRSIITKDIAASTDVTSETRYLDMACGRGLMLCGVGKWLKDAQDAKGLSPSVPPVVGADIFSGLIQV